MVLPQYRQGPPFWRLVPGPRSPREATPLPPDRRAGAALSEPAPDSG